MLLAHNVYDTNSIMYPYISSKVGGPETYNDIGASGCIAGGFGMRCIYDD
jgi:hypothetical protein